MSKFRVGEVLIVTRRVCKHAAHLVGTECRVERVLQGAQGLRAYGIDTEYVVSCIDGSEWGAADWHLRRRKEPPPINRWTVSWDLCPWKPAHLRQDVLTRKEQTEGP